jgi:hypothetical protein
MRILKYTKLRQHTVRAMAHPTHVQEISASRLNIFTRKKEQIGRRVKLLAGTTVPVRDRALTRCKKPLIGYKPIRGLQVSLSRSEGENYLPTATAAAAVLILKGE